MDYFVALVIGIPVVAVAAFGCALAQAKVVSSAVESMARQPSVAAKVQLAMIIGIAFIESLAIYSLMISFMLFGKLPKSEEVLKIFRKNTSNEELLSSAAEIVLQLSAK
ncbi:ATP synthase subunit c [Candidatus Kuenenia stuttgartiensis]|uniref:ATP synthase subunit c n=1 Tax=Kuenenia stuttgartiensis TaxID=174633 RepID=Q1Q3F6_KUEST|nr:MULTISPECIES: ATP synthase F0 subunit C [Kuenenia]MBE7546948.1 ATP synthase F0 subunit C [Planctomycetia bacterium]MCF6151421.1 ATP synthase F0 subunit C [Candidatus Kuenenia stuttgartiensis]MCZ7623122.1 ATP synthase F0 subunit C [Candidatus Kuenenia sp.]QII11661.1 ATP synthase subunit c [Candidatus Kuenenia stuttgartiensis]TVM02616.1 MAG: ATP synthase F0 subunit C [Candidatus Kuenenia stuttgartiensis]